MNSTVAIVGTHPGTREKAPYNDKKIDIWVFNNQILEGWCARAEVCFDMHPVEDIHRRRLEHAPFNEWLKEKKGLILYTPAAVPDCPDNKVYPLEEVTADLFPHLKRGEEVNQYYTSGPAYALALAIHMGYQRIELYGIEMESNTEYVYQRDGIGLMFGIAIGRGIDIYIPQESMMFYAPLYGYSFDGTKVDHEAFEVRQGELEKAIDQIKEAFDVAKGHLDSVNLRVIEMQKAGKSNDQIQVLRKEYEQAMTNYEQAIANLGFANGRLIECKSWKTRVERAMEFNGQAGQVLAVHDEKYQRFVDRHNLQTRDLPGGAPV